MPTPPAQTDTAFFPQSVRDTFAAITASNLPHLADLLPLTYTRVNSASVPAYNVGVTLNVPCRLVAITKLGAQQAIGSQISDASRYECIFAMDATTCALKQGDRLAVAGRHDATNTFTLTLEVIGAPVVSRAGTQVTVLCAPLRSPGNL